MNDGSGGSPPTPVDPPPDLYGIVTWEKRSLLDRVSVALYRLGISGAKTVVVLFAILLLFGIGGITVITQPAIGVLTILSIIPAVALAAYVWYSDITTNEPFALLAATFFLGIITAGFAAVVNGISRPLFEPLGIVGVVLFFFVIVGPVEETVKLLAVRLYAYNDDRFDAVIDGAVYGAVAGLGFATIENALFISRALANTGTLTLSGEIIGAGGEITSVRAMAAPGHVVLSAYAGYYLGLAKFNPGDRGPIVIKGLLIVAFVHAAYNTTVGAGIALIQAATQLPHLAAFLIFVTLYVGAFGYFLYRKIKRYRQFYLANRIAKQRAVMMDPPNSRES